MNWRFQQGTNEGHDWGGQVKSQWVTTEQANRIITRGWSVEGEGPGQGGSIVGPWVVWGTECKEGVRIGTLGYMEVSIRADGQNELRQITPWCMAIKVKGCSGAMANDSSKQTMQQAGSITMGGLVCMLYQLTLTLTSFDHIKDLLNALILASQTNRTHSISLLFKK